MKQVYSGKFDESVEKNRREGMAAGVESTPALFIDGRLNLLPIRPWYLAFTVDDELQWQKEKGWKFGAAPQGRARAGDAPLAAQDRAGDVFSFDDLLQSPGRTAAGTACATTRRETSSATR